MPLTSINWECSGWEVIRRKGAQSPRCRNESHPKGLAFEGDRVAAAGGSWRSHRSRPLAIPAGRFREPLKGPNPFDQQKFQLERGLEAEARIELANTGFANPRLTTWLLRRHGRLLVSRFQPVNLIISRFSLRLMRAVLPSSSVMDGSSQPSKPANSALSRKPGLC